MDKKEDMEFDYSPLNHFFYNLLSTTTEFIELKETLKLLNKTKDQLLKEDYLTACNDLNKKIKDCAMKIVKGTDEEQQFILKYPTAILKNYDERLCKQMNDADAKLTVLGTYPNKDQKINSEIEKYVDLYKFCHFTDQYIYKEIKERERSKLPC
jgi:hypothetical protein